MICYENIKSLNNWSQPCTAMGRKERSAGWESSFRGDLWQKNHSKSERKAGLVEDVKLVWRERNECLRGLARVEWEG